MPPIRSRTRPAPPTELARHVPLGELLALGTNFAGDISPAALLQDAADVIGRVTGMTPVFIRLRNADTDELEACAFSGLSDANIAHLRANPTPPAIYQALLRSDQRISMSFLAPPDQLLNPECPTHARMLIVPLAGRSGRLIGAIYVNKIEPFDLPTVQVLEAIARQAALAVEHVRMAARMQRLLTKEQLLAELARDVGATLELEAILIRTMEHLKPVLAGAAIILLDEHQQLRIAAACSPIAAATQAVRLNLGEGICGWVAQHGLPFLSNDIDHEARVIPATSHLGDDHPIHSYVAVPLRTGGQVIGVLAAESRQRNAFTYEDVDLLEAVAAQIGGPIGSAQLYQQSSHLAEQVRRRNEQLTVLNALARLAVSTLDVDRVLLAFVTQIQQGFGYDQVELYRVDETRQRLILVAQAGRFSIRRESSTRPLYEGSIGAACNAALTVLANQITANPRYAPFVGPETQAALCVPIIANGRVRAVLNIESQQPDAFTDEDVGVLETAADVLASALENARLYQRAQEAAVLEERSRLARDLHDSISQQLFSMTLTAQAARAQLDKNPARAASQLERLQETAAAALAEMRALIFQLRPPGLSEKGLITSLQQHVAGLGRREVLTCTLTVQGDEQYAHGMEQTIYRIAQEALNNVLKHAGACEVEVHLDLQPDGVALHVIDNGTGFDPEQIDTGDGRHLGLISMHERALELGGRLTVRSQPGQGAEVHLMIPRKSG